MLFRVLFMTNLILGLLFWSNIAPEPDWLVQIHMLIGILFVAAIWVVGLAQSRRKAGSIGLFASSFFIGLIIVFVGLNQESLLPTSPHWVIQVIHLLLAIAGIGIGEAAAARYKRGVAAASASAA